MKNYCSTYLRRGKRQKPTRRQTKYSFLFARSCWETEPSVLLYCPQKRHSIYTHAYISGRSFENIPQNGPEYSHRNLAIARFFVTAVRKNVRGLAVLVGLIVKVSPWANSPWVGKGPPCKSLGGGKGAAKAGYCPLVLLWPSQCTCHVCLKFVMSNSFNVWDPLANESIPLKHVLGWGGTESQGGGGVMWPLILYLELA